MWTKKGHRTGQKKPFKLEDIWRIRTRLEIEGNIMELALLNLAIDCKLRSCDLLRMKVRDISSGGIIQNRVFFVEELEEDHPHLQDLGLALKEVSAESMMYAMQLTGTYTQASRNDCFALALAKQEQCPLLTGDMALTDW